MGKPRYCLNCGEDISDRPKHHYLCYACWKKQNGYSNKIDDYDFLDDDYDDGHYSGYNETYYERYCGDSEYDMGPDWDYDEFPPENL